MMGRFVRLFLFFESTVHRMPTVMKLSILIQLLLLIIPSKSACDTVHGTVATRDRRANADEIKLVEYNVEWLWMDQCASWNEFHNVVPGLWGMPYEEAVLDVSENGGRLRVTADTGHQKLVGKNVKNAKRKDNGDSVTESATTSYANVHAILNAVQNNDKELEIEFDNDVKMVFNAVHTHGQSDITTFRANYHAVAKKIKYLTGPLPTTYVPAVQTHMQNIANRLDEINADIFVLIEVCDCATLEATRQAMPNHAARYRSYLLDSQVNRMKVGILSKIDPTVTGGTNADLSLIPGLDRGMQLNFEPADWYATIHLMATHLTAGPDAFTARTTQADALKTEWQKYNSGKYVILTGDFNSFDTHIRTSTQDISYSTGIQDIVLPAYDSDTTKLKYFISRPGATVTIGLTKNVSGTIDSNADAGDKGTAGKRVVRVIRRPNVGSAVTTNSDQYSVLNPVLTAVQANDKELKIFFEDYKIITYKPNHGSFFSPAQFLVDYAADTLKYTAHGIWLEYTLANRNSHCEIVADTDPLVVGSGMVGKYLTKVHSAFAADVPITTFASAEIALRAIKTDGSATAFTLTWTKDITDFYPVITTGANKLTDVAPAKGPVVNGDPTLNTVYTMNRNGASFPRNGRTAVYDYFFVGPMIYGNAIGGRGALSYLHKTTAQLGKHSDHDPVQLKLTKPDDGTWSTAKLTHYGNNLGYGYNKYQYKSNHKHQYQRQYVIKEQDSHLFMNNVEYLEPYSYNNNYKIVVLILSFILICIIFGIGSLCGFVFG
eukprot:497933_1